MSIRRWVGHTLMPLRPDIREWSGAVLDYVVDAANGSGYECKTALLAGVPVDVCSRPEEVGLFTQALFSVDGNATAASRVIAVKDLPAGLWQRSPLKYGDLDGRGGVEGSQTDRFAVSWNSGQFILTVMDRSNGVVAYVKQGGFPAAERGGPLRTPGHWLASEDDAAFLHAAALSVGGHAVLVGGPSGSGKSTLSIQALTSGLRIVGDDYVVASCGPSGPRVRAAYRSIKFRTGTAPAGLDADFDLSNGKAAHLLEAARVCMEAPIAACVAVDPSGPSVPESVDPAWVARTLSVSTILQVPLFAEHILASVSAIVSQVPCFRLGWSDTPERVAEALERMAAA